VLLDDDRENRVAAQQVPPRPVVVFRCHERRS
jgi:hypothetical protein